MSLMQAERTGSVARDSSGRPSGPGAAIVLSAGIGSAVYGLAVVGASASPSIQQALNWWAPGGPLVGKTSVGVIAWLASWLVLHLLWRRKELPFGKVWAVALTLIVLGFVLTFPPVFEAFAKH